MRDSVLPGWPPFIPLRSRGRSRDSLSRGAAVRVPLRSGMRSEAGRSPVASYHIQINTGAKGAALEHAQYIDRDGRFTEERYGEVADRGHGNMPTWAHEDTTAFWRASDEFERANGNTYREFELALPRELSLAARVALVQRFAEAELGNTRPYQWAIHTCTASDGKEQPHVHLMFSDRQLDGIERGPEQFFKRYNAKNPERGGARKFSYGADKAEAARTYEGIRERWAQVQNRALEAAGVEARVDHRSLADQGIHREPGVHRGPAVSGIEARGERSEVGERQREQLLERSEARSVVEAEVRTVTREELAAERVAARERRELAREVTGADRDVVLPLVEADRREQLGRAQAAAERRIERRQGLGVGTSWGKKLVDQARALRERIGREVGRVKDWVREHFPDPLKVIKERSREVFDAVAEKVRGRAPAAPGQDPPEGRKRGKFEGLKLRAEPTAKARRPEPQESSAAELSPALHRSLDRYAQAWTDGWRMRKRELPVLEHQKTEFKASVRELDGVRPGASEDLHNALKFEPKARQAMTQFEGRRRSTLLLDAIEHERRIEADPNLKADRFVKAWNALEAEREALKGSEHKQAREAVQERQQGMTRELKGHPPLEAAMYRRRQELGIEPESRLGLVMAEKDLKRALSLSSRDLGRDYGLSL